MIASRQFGDTCVVIRRLEERDAHPVALIEEATFSMPWHEDSFIRLAQQDHELYVVAEADGAVIGCCGATMAADEGYVNNVVVAEMYRGRGIGTFMLDAVLKLARSYDVVRFALDVRRSNAAAIKMYESLGFQAVGSRPDFYHKPAEDALVMCLTFTGRGIVC